MNTIVSFALLADWPAELLLTLHQSVIECLDLESAVGAPQEREANEVHRLRASSRHICGPKGRRQGVIRSRLRRVAPSLRDKPTFFVLQSVKQRATSTFS